ncbi:MAG: hypothetical protein EOP04_01865 [Proteobacteria bacterium]|nr:MAG: hypothetical protein EOP04_01865 [Pseudomonadota bacterium]
MAKLSGVSYPTVRRIHTREGGEPDLGNVLSILSVVTTTQNTKLFVRKHYQKHAHLIEPSLTDFQPLDGLANMVRFTIHDFLAIGLASTKNGVSEQELVGKSGVFGVRALENLLAAGVIERFENRYVTVAKEVRTIGTDRILQSIAHLCDVFDYERVDSRGSLFRLKTEGLTKEAVLEIYKILYEVSDKIQEIMLNEKNKGEYVLGVGLVSTFLNFPKGEPNL